MNGGFEFDAEDMNDDLGLGGGMAFSWTRGLGSEALVSQSDRTQVGYVGASGRVGVVLTRTVWLVLCSRIGFVVPEVKVNFAGESVARWGRPLIEGFLNMEAKFQ